MSKRLALLTALIIIVLSGCAQLPPEIVPPSSPAGGETVSGQAVGERTPELTTKSALRASYVIRLYGDSEMTDLLYEVKVEDGTYTVSAGDQVVLYFDGQAIYSGPDHTDEPLYNVDSDHVRTGGSPGGPIAYTVKEGKVHQGDDTGAIRYTIADGRMVDGASPDGALVFQADNPLPRKIQYLLPILAQ